MKIFYCAVLCFLMLSCSGFRKITTVYVNQETLGPGSSGMAQVDSNSFLAVYDLKNFEKGPRLGLIRTYADSIRVFPVQVADWKSTDGIPSDLEAITRIHGKQNEYLISESGNWQGGIGRIFHIKFQPKTLQALVKGVIPIPMVDRNDFDTVGDQYEGIACMKCNKNICTILLSERGGSTTNPNGKLKWAEVNLSNHTMLFSNDGAKGFEIDAPGEWNDKEKRDLTDIYIDSSGDIWASASQDQGDSGPFYSVIYQIGKADDTANPPFQLLSSMEVYKAFPGYKIEALSGPSNSAPNSRFSFGTEDEIYGGTWRPIE